MDTTTDVLQPDHKYGLVVLPKARVDRSLPEVFEVAPSFRAFQKPPFGTPDEHWKEWLGTFWYESIQDADLFLLVDEMSSSPEVLDAGNEACRQKAYRWYWALLLTGTVAVDEDPILITGARTTDGVSVRGVRTEKRPYRTRGSAVESIGERHLRDAQQLEKQMRRLSVYGGFRRFHRARRAFDAGIHSESVDEQLHQFVRCVEGLIKPPKQKSTKKFKSRTELFVGVGQHPVMEELYNLRSWVEHLHHPLGIADGSDGEAANLDGWRHFFLRTHQAEEIARHCIRSVYMREDLWPHFCDDESIENFWRTELKQEQQRAEDERLWGSPISLSELEGRFDPEAIDANNFSSTG